jgi:hypothetical protein
MWWECGISVQCAVYKRSGVLLVLMTPRRRSPMNVMNTKVVITPHAPEIPLIMSVVWPSNPRAA